MLQGIPCMWLLWCSEMHFITCYDICRAKKGLLETCLFSALSDSSAQAFAARIASPALRDNPGYLQPTHCPAMNCSPALCHRTKHLPKEAVLTTGNKHTPCCFPEMSSLQRCRGGLLLGNPCKLNSQVLAVLLRPMVNLSAMASEGPQTWIGTCPHSCNKCFCCRGSWAPIPLETGQPKESQGFQQLDFAALASKTSCK